MASYSPLSASIATAPASAMASSAALAGLSSALDAMGESGLLCLIAADRGPQLMALDAARPLGLLQPVQ